MCYTKDKLRVITVETKQKQGEIKMNCIKRMYLDTQDNENVLLEMTEHGGTITITETGKSWQTKKVYRLLYTVWDSVQTAKNKVGV